MAGLWGAVASVADAAFEAVTGKDFGDTVLALFTGHHDGTPVAGNGIDHRQRALPRRDAAPPMPDSPPCRRPDVAALQPRSAAKAWTATFAQRALWPPIANP